jgi:Flp pilus assembly protein TadD
MLSKEEEASMTPVTRTRRAPSQCALWRTDRCICASVIAILAWGIVFARTAMAAEACEPAVAQVVSIQGRIEIQRAGQAEWIRVERLDTRLCEGDRLRVGPLSRAALLIGPETLIRVDQNTAIGLRVTPDETRVEFDSGAIYSISRFPRRFRIITPFVNAGVEGTEFLVAVRADHAEIAVYEGRVAAEDRVGEPGARTLLRDGQVARFARGAPPAVRVLVNPADAVQWALYYPPLDSEPIQELPACERLAAGERPGCFAARASKLLRLGRVENAERDIEAALALAPGNADALALGSIIRVVKNDKPGALDLARRAVSQDPKSARAVIALSYAQQADFKLEDALASASRAAELEPANAVAQARRAELLLSVGRIKDAEAAASAAVRASPADSRARTVLGFAHLARLDTAPAREQLVQAAALDSSDPLPRLGLGLAAIKDGKLAEGRTEIEVAVALDPQNALLRSYLGKAYSDELRDALAEVQLERAKQLDPRDPTAWFYNAIRLQALNRPGEALEELQGSVERNESRAVYRSRLLLDQDQAARSASLAHIYSDLGFDQLALSEGMRALNTDPRNFAAHRFLAEAYQTIPRFELARVSELLQTQMLQPAASAVLAPRLGETRIPMPQGAGPITASFHEFNPLFARDGHLLSLGGVIGGQHTIGDEALYAYRRGSRTVQFGQFYFETDGFRENADLRQKSYSLFYQDDFSVASSWQLEGRTTRIDNGDVRLQFDPATFSPNERKRTETQSLRLGLRHSPSPDSTWLASFITSERVENSAFFFSFPGLLIDLKDRFQAGAESGELQYLGRARSLDVIAGGGLVRERDSTRSVEVVTFDPFPPDPPTETSARSRARHGNAYAYGLWRAPAGSIVTTGLAVDDFHDEVRFSQRRYSPKLGLVVPMSTGTTVRAAAFRSVRRLITTNRTLEPTQVAGFNQLFDDVNQTRSQRLGAAIDQRFSRGLFGGVELTRRDLEVPILGAGNTLSHYEDWDERLHRAYASWVVTPQLGASIDYMYEHRLRELPPGVGDVIPVRTTTHYAPFTITYHHPRGPFAAFRAGYVSQKVRFVDPSGAETAGEDDFWIADASLGTRLPRRLGSISLDVLNLFDERFRHQDTDFLGTARVPQFQPKRLVLFRVRINLS